MQWIANAADVKNAMHLVKLAKSFIQVALLKKALLSATSEPSAWLLRLAHAVSLGTNPPVVSHVVEQGGSLGLLVGELAKLGRAQAVLLLRWPFKAISHQLRRRQPGNFFTSSLGWYQKSGQTQLLLRMFTTDPWGSEFEGLFIKCIWITNPCKETAGCSCAFHCWKRQN